MKALAKLLLKKVLILFIQICLTSSLSCWRRLTSDINRKGVSCTRLVGCFLLPWVVSWTMPVYSLPGITELQSLPLHFTGTSQHQEGIARTATLGRRTREVTHKLSNFMAATSSGMITRICDATNALLLLLSLRQIINPFHSSVRKVHSPNLLKRNVQVR